MDDHRRHGIISADRLNYVYELKKNIKELAGSAFVKNVYETVAAKVFLIVIGMISSIAIARILGPDGRGLYFLAVSIGATGVQFTNLGLHASNTYYVARDRKLLPALVGNSIIIGLCFGSLIAFLAWLVFTVMPSAAPMGGALLAISMIWIPLGLSYMLVQNLLVGINEVRAYNIVEMLIKVMALILLAVVFIFGLISPESVFFIDLIAAIVGLGLVFMRLKNHIHTPRISFTLFKDSIGYGFKAYMVCLLSFLVIRSGIFIVDYFLDATQLGYYSIALSMGDMFYLIPTVIGMILFPRLSSVESPDEKREILRKVVFYSAAGLLVMALLTMLLADPVIRLMYGNQYAQSVPAFLFLLPGLYFLSVETIMVQYLNSEGLPGFVIVAWAVTLVVNVVGNLLLIPDMGIVGASIASSISYVLIAILMWLYIRRKGALNK